MWCDRKEHERHKAANIHGTLCEELSLRPDGVYQLESNQDQEIISLYFEPRQANREQPQSTPKVHSRF